MRRAVWFLLALAWRVDRARLLKACALLAAGFLATPFIGLLLKGFTGAALSGRAGAAAAWAAGLAVLLVCELMAGHFAHLYYFELGEAQEQAIDADLIAIAGGGATVRHLDDPRFADTLALVRQDVAQTRPALEAVLQLAGLALQATVTTVILATVNPWLMLLPVAALPPVLLSRRAQELIDRAKQAHAPQLRATGHLLGLAADPSAATQVQLCAAGEHLTTVHTRQWAVLSRAMVRAHTAAAGLRAAGQVAFAAAYGVGLLLVVRQAAVGDIVLVVTLAVQVSVQVAGALGQLATVQAAARTVARLDRLRAATAVRAAETVVTRPVPDRLRDGIRLDRVGFTYPGAAAPALHDVTLHLPAGATVAVVGENGAGKSTLVKLLCGLYEPDTGTIRADGCPVGGPAWQARVATLFQDFARLRLPLRDNIGIGDLPRLHDDAAIRAALHDAGAAHLAALLPSTVDAELSGGQWQQAGLARTLMRRRPLLLVLDEPAAALDAPAEHALFARFAALAPPGAVTVFVSHRFSTVGLADLIVVLGDGGVLQAGTHAELAAAEGLYSQLYAMQARAYR